MSSKEVNPVDLLLT